jgi:hypothetical protein
MLFPLLHWKLVISEVSVMVSSLSGYSLASGTPNGGLKSSYLFASDII